MRAMMIWNPTATNVTPSRLRVVERALEATFDLEVATTNHRGHGTVLAREAVAAGAKSVIALGGDGTVNEVVNGLVTGDSTDIALGILPGGGTNVFARALGYPRDVVDATGHLLERVERDRVRRVSLGRARVRADDRSLTRLFVQNCGLAIDAETVRRVEAKGSRSKLGDVAFVLAWFGAIRDVRRHDEPPIDVDGEPVWWVAIANGDPMTYWRSRPLRTAPRASHDRGLDVLAGRRVPRLRTIFWGAQALTTGRHVRHRDLIYREDVARSRMTARVPIGLQVDGEYLGLVRALEVESLPAALPVYA